MWIHCVFSDTWRAQRVVSIGGVKRVGCAFNVDRYARYDDWKL